MCHKIKEYLIRLDAFVGLEELKENLLDQLIYFIHEKDDDYLHTVLYGKPGTGKTEIAMLLGKIYTKLGILSKGTFVKVTRSDFVAGYLGQTAIKTRKLIEENLGGVVFIDEAYAMGNEEKRDSFSKEALDTLCELLSDHKSELMVIIAGYKEELDKCFFSYNPGLESRFAWKFEISPYNAEELSQIFKKKIHDASWFLDSNVNLASWIEERIEHFKSYGRDIENLFSKCKICHFRRVFGKKEKTRVMSMEDLENGFKKFTKIANSSNEKEMKPNFMYT
jgi:SpoVK/Ycf46/Vps4 family AAA+-type ATPase